MISSVDLFLTNLDDSVVGCGLWSLMEKTLRGVMYEMYPFLDRLQQWFYVDLPTRWSSLVEGDLHVDAFDLPFFVKLTVIEIIIPRGRKIKHVVIRC